MLKVMGIHSCMEVSDIFLMGLDNDLDNKDKYMALDLKHLLN
jgi:hypothetical protein